MSEQPVSIATPFITLDAFLKWAGVTNTGGEAKTLIASGAVRVNGAPDTRRGRKLYPGDRVSIAGVGTWRVEGEEA